MKAITLKFGGTERGEETWGEWWLFLLTGVAWFVFALLVFRWNYTSVYAVSFLFGVVAVVAGVNEVLHIAAWTIGWKIVHGALAAAFIGIGIWALVHPHTAFETLAALIGLFFLCKGVFDLAAALMDRGQFDLWWIQLTVGIIELFLAFWVAGNFERKTILLVVYVGVVALTRGFTELVLAVKARGGPPPGNRIATA